MPNSDPVIQQVLQEAQDRADAEQASKTGIQKKLGMPLQIDVKNFMSGMGDNMSSSIFDNLGSTLADSFNADSITKGLSGDQLNSSLSLQPSKDLEEDVGPAAADNDPTSGVFDGGGDIDLG